MDCSINCIAAPSLDRAHASALSWQSYLAGSALRGLPRSSVQRDVFPVRIHAERGVQGGFRLVETADEE